MLASVRQDYSGRMKSVPWVRTLVLLLAVVTGCAPTLRANPVATDVSFAAHVEHRGIVVDEMQGAAPAVLQPASWQSFGGGPRFLLEAHDTTLAALWLPESGHMIVRQTSDPQSRLIGEVDATWKESAIRLTFKLPNGSAFQTAEFARIGGRVGTAALGVQAASTADLEGVYRAELRDAQGAPAGWLRVQINGFGDATRIYDGVLPPPLSGPLEVAAVALLDSDVSHVADHLPDIHMGN